MRDFPRIVWNFRTSFRFPPPCEPGCGWRGGAVWRALLDSARFFEGARVAARGPEEASRGEALKMIEDAKVLRLSAAGLLRTPAAARKAESG